MAFCLPKPAFERLPAEGAHLPHDPGIPQWAASATPLESSSQEEVIRLQTAIESGDVALAAQWASNLARRKIKLNIDIDPEEKKKGEEEIRVNIHIENKELALGCVQLNVKPSFTIATLKLTVLTIYGFPPDIQKWIIGQQIANDESTLAQCGVSNSGASLFLYLVSAQSVGLTPKKFREKYGHLVKQGIPGLPRSLSLSSSVSNEEKVGNANTPTTPVEARAIYLSMRVPQPVIKEVNEPPPRPPPPRFPPPAETPEKREETPDVFPPPAEAPPRPLTDEENKDKFGWSCKVCTYKNWPTWPGCEMCDTQRPDGYRAPDGYTLCAREQERADSEAVSEAAARERGTNSRTAARPDRLHETFGSPSPVNLTPDFSKLDEELARQFNQEWNQGAYMAAGASSGATPKKANETKTKSASRAAVDLFDGPAEVNESLGHPAFDDPETDSSAKAETKARSASPQIIGHPDYDDFSVDPRSDEKSDKPIVTKQKPKLDLIGHPSIYTSDDSDIGNEFV